MSGKRTWFKNSYNYSKERYETILFGVDPSAKNGWLKLLLIGVGLTIGLTILIWFICGLFIIGSTWSVFWRDTLGMLHDGFFPGGLPTPFFWILFSIVVAVGLVLRAHLWVRTRKSKVIAWILAPLLVLASTSLAIVKQVTYDILGSDYYLTSTTFKVKDGENLPAMLEQYVDRNLIEVKLEEGDLTNSWVPRAASMTGAMLVLDRTSSSANSNELMDNSVTYLYGDGDSGVWTGIRNGKGQQNIFGISSWDGTGGEDRIQTCRFEDNYELTKNFGGPWGKDLWNVVASAYPSFFYNKGDIWGYCKDGEPIIVLPGVTLGHTDMRTTNVPAGVVTIQGSLSGEPVLHMLTDLKPGDLPGPVYPQRVVNDQRNALDWAAGYYQSVNERFGFDTTDVEAQKGNTTNYLLKSKEDGRLYWVTPMKVQDSQEETIIAYSVVSADTLTPGALNDQIVYILHQDDNRKVNLDDLSNVAKTKLCNLDDNFCTKEATGNIVEFLPVSDTHWQVFGEVDGRVLYLIDIEVGSTVKTTATVLENADDVETDDNPSPEPGTPATCDTPSTLTEEQIADCLSALVRELQGRNAPQE